MQTRDRAHCARSVFPFIKKKKMEEEKEEEEYEDELEEKAERREGRTE